MHVIKYWGGYAKVKSKKKSITHSTYLSNAIITSHAVYSNMNKSLTVTVRSFPICLRGYAQYGVH